MSVTDGDRAKAEELMDAWDVDDGATYLDLARTIAAALAAEREKARAPFLALAEELSAEADRAALLTSMAAVVATRVNRETAERIRRVAEDS